MVAAERRLAVPVIGGGLLATLLAQVAFGPVAALIVGLIAAGAAAFFLGARPGVAGLAAVAALAVAYAFGHAAGHDSAQRSVGKRTAQLLARERAVQAELAQRRVDVRVLRTRLQRTRRAR